MSESIKTIKKEKLISQITVAEGWVRTKRDSKSVSFIDLNDGSCLKGLQVVADHCKIDSQTLSKITTGCSIKCTGVLVSSEGKDQDVEMQAEKIEILGEAPDTYPLQKKHHTLEYLREIAHLRPRTNTIGAVARVRSTMAYAVHKFFQEKGFYYVNTPIITASDAEGAGQMFQVTTLNFENVPKTEDGKIDWSRDFFGKKTNLTVSGQLEGESYACALRNIYTFGPTFRAENSNTKRHLAEFWMIEPEMAFCTLDSNIDIAEAFLKFVFKYTLDNCEQEMDFFSKYVQEGVKETIKHVVETPFVRIKYTDAIKELEKSSESFEFKPYWGCDLQTEHERFLTEQVFKCPVAVTDYPKEIKSFYMKANDDGKTVRAVDILVPRLGEIIGGSERENNLDKLLARMKELSLNEKDYSWYLDLRRYGSVPHSGFGLGFERAVQYVSGMQNIRDVIPFPRAVGQAEF